MAKRNHTTANDENGTADQLITDQTIADQAVSSDVPPADATPAITMEDFISRADRTDWLSVAEAARYLTDVRGATDIDSQKMRNAANNRKEFAADGAMLKVAIPGYEIKPLTYLHRSAVDVYQDNNVSGNTRSGRVVANGKRWIIRVKAEDQTAVVAALSAFGITLETASAAHKPKSADADADTIAANAEQSADQLYTDQAYADNTDADNPGANQVDMQRTEELSFA